MTVKLFDSELKVMEVLWKEGELPAKDIAAYLKGRRAQPDTLTKEGILRRRPKPAVKSPPAIFSLPSPGVP